MYTFSNLFYVNFVDWLALHLKFDGVHYLTIGWNFSVPCRPIKNLMACTYRLKCSPSAHI